MLISRTAQSLRLTHYFMVCCVTAYLLVGTVAAQDDELNTWQNWYANYQNNSFVIEIKLSPDNGEKLQQRLDVFRKLLLYIPASPDASNTELNLRIGFFKSRMQAQEFLEASQFIFQGQSVVRISAGEHQQVMAALAKSDPVQTNFLVFPIARTADLSAEKYSKKMLDAAKRFYMGGQYQQALNYYHLLAAIADERTAVWASELSGLCYEKLGDIGKAESTYQKLLARYPGSEGQPRVEQRLRALQTAAEDGRQVLAKSRNKSDEGRRTFFRGDLGQTQRSLNRSINDGDSSEVMSTLATDFDFRGSSSWNNQTVRARINGFWLKDQLDGEDSEFRVRRVYVDYLHEGTGIDAVLGRQKEFDSGIYTSFDGASLTYPLNNVLELSASIGKPVYFSDVYDDLDYFFYSIYGKYQINQNWDFTTYLVEQTLNDVTDRQAIGIRTSYASERLSTTLNVDYDQAFAELNNFLFNTNYLVMQNLNLTAMYGKQRSPFLSAANILIGQADLDLELYLQSQVNQDTLLEDALARTSINTYYSLALNYKLPDMGRIIVDYYQSDLTDIPTQELLTGTPSTQISTTEFSQTAIGIQLVMESAFFATDSASLGIRSTDGSSSSSTTLFLSDRIRIGNTFFVYPKVHYSQVSFATRREDQNQLRYSISLGYKPFRNMELNFEWGNESISVTGGNDDFQSDYFFIGYRVHF